MTGARGTHGPIRRGGLAACLLTAALLPGCGGGEPSEEPVIRPVRVERVTEAGGERTRSFSGAARAGVESRLSFRVAGRLEEIGVKVGDRVQEGDLIARLDTTDFRLRLQDAEAALTRARAEERRADASYRRTMQLYENRNASKAELDAARATAEAATAQVTSAEQNVELARRNLEYTRLVAPTGGAISEVPVEVNENVGSGTTVAVLASGDAPEVTCSIPEAFIAPLRKGDAVTVRFDAIPGEAFPATLTEIGVVASGRGGVFPITARLDEATTEVRPGMAAEIEFRFDRSGSGPGIYVPAFAVLEDERGRHAFVAEPTEDGLATVRRRDVQVGELSAAGLEIREGLADGDLLVTAGVTKLRDGMAVRLPRTEAP
jgi:RND family efflux transporter MFP subunit